MPHPFATPEEADFAALMERRGVMCRRPETSGGRIDFYLPEFDLFVEIKQHPCERLLAQMESCGPNASVMVLCGPQAVRDFGIMLNILLARRT